MVVMYHDCHMRLWGGGGGGEGHSRGGMAGITGEGGLGKAGT